MIPQLPFREHLCRVAACRLKRSAKWSINGLKSSYSIRKSGCSAAGHCAARFVRPSASAWPFCPPFFAGRSKWRVGRIPVDFVPSWMVRQVATAIPEYGVRLRVLLGKRIDGNAVMLQELLNAYERGGSVKQGA